MITPIRYLPWGVPLGVINSVRYPKKPFGTATESDGITPKQSDKEEGDYEFDVSVYEKRKGSYLIRLEVHEENMHQAFSIF